MQIYLIKLFTNRTVLLTSARFPLLLQVEEKVTYVITSIVATNEKKSLLSKKRALLEAYKHMMLINSHQVHNSLVKRGKILFIRIMNGVVRKILLIG